MRRILIGLGTAVLALLVILGALGAAGVASGNASTVTQPRLERSLAATFANLYSQQAQMLGHRGVSPTSLHAKAMCDKHGPQVPNSGPGGDWICLMSWTDPNVPMPPEGYGKFELNVHSNDCYTASGPTKLTGYLTLTDKNGTEVPNPVFEFDGCFDPHGDNSATGTSFPSLLSVTSTTVTPDSQGRAKIQLGCGTGDAGCAGQVTASAGGTALGTQEFAMSEESVTTITLPTALPNGAQEVELTLNPSRGTVSSDSVTLPVQGAAGLGTK